MRSIEQHCMFGRIGGIHCMNYSSAREMMPLIMDNKIDKRFMRGIRIFSI